MRLTHRSLLTSIYILVLLLIVSCSGNAATGPSQPVASPTPAPRSQGRAVEILYGGDATQFIQMLFADREYVRMDFTNQAFAEGWQPWLAKVALESKQGCLTSTPVNFTKDMAEVSIVDTGGYAREARIMLHDSIYGGLRWHVCDGTSVMAYIWGAMPRNQKPASGSYDMNNTLVPLDFNLSAAASFPMRQDFHIDPTQKQTFSLQNAEINLEALPPTQDRYLGDMLNVRVTVTNNGGYDMGRVKLTAVDNFGRYFNSTSGDTGILGPGLTHTEDLAAMNPFPGTAPGAITSAVFTVFLTTDSSSYTFVGTFYADLTSVTPTAKSVVASVS